MIKLCYMKKQGKIIEGIYQFKEPNSWESVVYFKKPKQTSQEDYDRVIKKLIHDT